MAGNRTAALIGLALLTGMFACNKPEDGCLDIYASNYNVDADRQCPDCCEYPATRLALEHKVVIGGETNNLAFDTLKYFDGAGNRFAVASLKYYLSEMHLIRGNGETVISTDTVSLRFPQSPGDTLIQSVENNFALADPSNFRERQMGSLRADGQFEHIRMLLGLQGPANDADPAYIPDQHPLADEEMYLSDSHEHIFTRLELFTIDTPGDTLRTLLEIAGEGSIREMVYPASFYLDPGFSPRVVVQVDYQKWFNSINLKGMTEEEMESRLLETIPSAMQLVSVTTVLD